MDLWRFGRSVVTCSIFAWAILAVFVKSGRNGAFAVALKTPVSLRYLFLTNLHRLNQGGPAPDCLATALAKPIPNPAYNWFAIAIKLLIAFLICPLRLRS